MLTKISLLTNLYLYYNLKKNFCLTFHLSFVLEELSLQQAVVISRHGSRTLLTKDHKTFEEASDSQLTVRGMDQMFRAGEFVHSHFHEMKFNFSDLYSKSPQEIYVRSSDYSRTLNR